MALSVGDYDRYHQDRLNLAIHIVMVPVFIVSALSLLWSLLTLDFFASAGSLLGMAVAIALQGFGHKRELNPPEPFLGPGDAMARVFREQFLTFPAFVLNGGWARAWGRASGG